MWQADMNFVQFDHYLVSVVSHMRNFLQSEVIPKPTGPTRSPYNELSRRRRPFTASVTGLAHNFEYIACVPQ